MDLNNQNSPTQPTVPGQPTPQEPTPQMQLPPKKWYQHKGIITIIVLAIVVAIVSCVYFANQPAQDISSIVIQHKVQQPLATSTPQQTLTSTPSQTDISNWQTYTNSQYGFSFQYPSDFIFDNNSLSLQKGDLNISLQVSANNQAQTEASGQEESPPASQSEPVKINQYTWQKTDLGDIAGNDTTYFIESSDKKTFITFDVAQGALLGSADQNSVYQILSTFQFINAPSAISIPKCGGSITNNDNPVDPKIIATISKNNTEVSQYTNNGYKIEQVCGSSNKTLLFLDFANGYWNDATSVSDTELAKLAQQVILGVSDQTFNQITFYPTNIPDYSFEGDGSMGCNFDSLTSGDILYICDNAGDSGDTETWYAYDTQAQSNIKVKYTFTDYTPDAPPSSDQTQTYRPDLLSLFTVQK